MGHENLKARTKTFALDVVCLCAGLPRRTETSQVLSQLHRCATSVAANYRAACRAKSTADFIAKLGTVEEEADESTFWLECLKDLNTRRNLKFDLRTSQELEPAPRHHRDLEKNCTEKPFECRVTSVSSVE